MLGADGRNAGVIGVGRRAVRAADRTPWASGLRQLTYVVTTQPPLRGDALAQRLADDVDPAFGAELGQDVRDVGLHGTPGQEHAAGDIRGGRAPGDHGGDLDLGRGERVPARGGARPPLAADAEPDAVGAKTAAGPADVPGRLQAVVAADRLLHGGPGLVV